jgi:DNA-binding HxlR family transcriptional regulator
MEKRRFSCGLEAALAMIGGKWKLLILWHLAQGPRRFGNLRRLTVGISEKMLIQELKEMVADQLVSRRDFQEVPPRVEYSLTRLGQTLAAALEPLCQWGSQYLQPIDDLPLEPLLEPDAQRRDDRADRRSCTI